MITALYFYFCALVVSAGTLATVLLRMIYNVLKGIRKDQKKE